MQKNTLKAGETIAYTRAFLKSISGDYATASRRGVFLAYDGNFARVRWNDTNEAALTAMAAQYGDDYAEDVKANGSRVFAGNICRIKSVAFAD